MRVHPHDGFPQALGIKDLDHLFHRGRDERVRAAIRDLFGPEALKEHERRFGGEDFSHVLQRVAAYYAQHRGDVRQSDVVAERNVHVPSLFEGKLGFEDSVSQGYDDKELDSSKVPGRALAAVRSAVAFTERYTDTPAFDLSRYRQDGELVSSTDQLRWKEADDNSGGSFTIDTPATQAVVGFAAGRTAKLSRVTIEPKTRFAAIYVTARGRDETLDSAREVLIVALARARNTGMKFSPDGSRMLAPGSSPILMEPIAARITLRRQGSPKVFILDHDGRLTNRQIPVENGIVTIDGARDKCPYYLIRY